jgi:hypothetical protein
MNNLKLAKDDLNNIIEEKCPHSGIVLNRYSKGRRLGKVFLFLNQGRIRSLSLNYKSQKQQKISSQNHRQDNTNKS